MRKLALPVLVVVCLGVNSLSAQAQVPYTIPPSAGYYQPVQPPYYQPVQPGGFITGNLSPAYPGYYDPNRPVSGSSSSSMYWDPYRGWVTNTNNTTVLNSALSPGRTPMPGTAIQNYRYWNGTQWVQGQRWLGMDGQWHGVNTDTTVGPNGTNSNTTVYAPNPNAGVNTNTNTTVYSARPR